MEVDSSCSTAYVDVTTSPSSSSSHVVDIPNHNNIHEEEHQDEGQSLTASFIMREHPLGEIADSSGHLLQMKLWHKEEERIAMRMELKESSLDKIRKQLFTLSCLHFFFNATVLILLVTTHNPQQCHKWWVPSSMACMASVVMVTAMEYNIIIREHVVRRLGKDRADCRAIARCLYQLRMKGLAFTLPSDDPQFPYKKRMKSSSVEYRSFFYKSMCSPHAVLVPLLLIFISALLFPASKFIACY